MILWSFTAYDSQTRSLLEHDQKTAELDSHSKGLKANADGSYTVTGVLKKVVIELGKSRLTASDQKEIQEANKKLAAVRD